MDEIALSLMTGKSKVVDERVEIKIKVPYRMKMMLEFLKLKNHTTLSIESEKAILQYLEEVIGYEGKDSKQGPGKNHHYFKSQGQYYRKCAGVNELYERGKNDCLRCIELSENSDVQVQEHSNVRLPHESPQEHRKTDDEEGDD